MEEESIVATQSPSLRLNKRYEVLTPSGFSPFYGIRKITKTEWFEITFTDKTKVGCSTTHVVELSNGKYCEVRNLGEGAELKGPGNKTIISIEFREDPIEMYDVVDTVDHLYLGNGFISHNCEFLSSGETVFEPDDLIFYEQTYQKDPMERRGVDGNLWIWEAPDYSKSYMVVADVARGDGADYSGFHVMEIESATQVAEYRGKLPPRDFGNVLVGIASEYNDALLVVENASMGWSTIEQILAREYRNLYYSSSSRMETAETYAIKYERDKLVPGFTMTSVTRPLVIAKFMEYIRDRSTIVQSKRLIHEMRVFIWKNGRAQAQTGYNDDLVMSFATGLYVRDTALRLKQQGMDLARAQLSSFGNLNAKNQTIIMTNVPKQGDPYKMKSIYGVEEDISWVLK